MKSGMLPVRLWKCGSSSCILLFVHICLFLPPPLPSALYNLLLNSQLVLLPIFIVLADVDVSFHRFSFALRWKIWFVIRYFPVPVRVDLTQCVLVLLSVLLILFFSRQGFVGRKEKSRDRISKDSTMVVFIYEKVPVECCLVSRWFELSSQGAALLFLSSPFHQLGCQSQSLLVLLTKPPQQGALCSSSAPLVLCPITNSNQFTEGSSELHPQAPAEGDFLRQWLWAVCCLTMFSEQSSTKNEKSFLLFWFFFSALNSVRVC